MSIINNSDLTKEIIAGAKTNIAVDTVPSQLADKVVPVMEVNPKLMRRVTFVKTKTGSTGTIYTTPSDKDFFLVGYSMTASNKTASQDSSLILGITPNGFSSINVDSLTFSTSVILDVNQQDKVVMLPLPMQLARGSVLETISTNISSSRVTIFGYEI